MKNLSKRYITICRIIYALLLSTTYAAGLSGTFQAAIGSQDSLVKIFYSGSSHLQVVMSFII